jgi:phage shock protein C
MNTTSRYLVRSRQNQMVAGVASGIARTLQVDVVIVRLGFVALALAGIGLWLYPLLWIIIPLEPVSAAATGVTTQLRFALNNDDDSGTNIPIDNLPSGDSPGQPDQPNRLLAYVMLGAGVILLLGLIPGFWPFMARALLPIVLIGAGIWFLRRNQ